MNEARHEALEKLYAHVIAVDRDPNTNDLDVIFSPQYADEMRRAAEDVNARYAGCATEGEVDAVGASLYLRRVLDGKLIDDVDFLERKVQQGKLKLYINGNIQDGANSRQLYHSIDATLRANRETLEMGRRFYRAMMAIYLPDGNMEVIFDEGATHDAKFAYGQCKADGDNRALGKLLRYKARATDGREFIYPRLVVSKGSKAFQYLEQRVVDKTLATAKIGAPKKGVILAEADILKKAFSLLKTEINRHYDTVQLYLTHAEAIAPNIEERKPELVVAFSDFEAAKEAAERAHVDPPIEQAFVSDNDIKNIYYQIYLPNALPEARFLQDMRKDKEIDYVQKGAAAMRQKMKRWANKQERDDPELQSQFTYRELYRDVLAYATADNSSYALMVFPLDGTPKARRAHEAAVKEKPEMYNADRLKAPIFISAQHPDTERKCHYPAFYLHKSSAAFQSLSTMPSFSATHIHSDGKSLNLYEHMQQHLETKPNRLRSNDSDEMAI